MPGPGLTCQNNLDCTLFDDCVEVTRTPHQSINLAQDDGACRIGDNLVEDDISLRQAGQEGCPRGQVSFISMLTNMTESKMNYVAIIMFLAVFCCF